jgi:3'-phosphoadenosine 5'-phosphosulfate sulfotransferase (PAPS reductase)/FAD synthetase
MIPDLSSYDVLLLNTSGGKDSQAMLDYLVELADEVGVRHKVTAVHADLGRMEWPGTKELAIAQAAHYDVRTIVVRRNGGDLLSYIEARGKFPDSARRYCTSDFKRGPVTTAMTSLVRQLNLGRPARILNCMGMRAQESKARAKKPPFAFNQRATGKGRVRHVDDWLPIHSWPVEQVWARIAVSGVPYHPAYDWGMPRLSCSFCVLASKGALVRAAQLRPDLAAEYAAVEARIGHDFRKDLSMAEIIRLGATTEAPPVEDWAA